jgi:hypothetical protein
MAVYAAPDGVPTTAGGDGTEARPWPLQFAIDQLGQLTDHHLVLLPGVYDGPIDIAGLDSGASYVITGLSTDSVAIDGSRPEFRTVPNAVWQHVGGPASQEYVSAPFLGNDPARGSFLARSPYTRLITHQFLRDLQSDNELAGPICDDNPMEGPDPRPPDAQHPGVNPRRPWMYLGPGLFHDPTDVRDGRIHVRFSPTHHHLPGFPDYDGETDPRKIPLAIWFEQRATLRITGCTDLTVCNLGVRHGDTAITIENCDDVTLDHVDVRGGNDGIKLRGTCNRVHLTHVRVDGGLPPWYFRSDRKDEFHLASDPGFGDAQAPGQNTMKALLSGTPLCSDSIVSNCEFVGGHDLATFGKRSRFSRNWIQNLDDDAVIVDTEGSDDLQFFENVVEQCQTVFSSGGGAGKGTSVYRNLIDLRRPFAKSRPRVHEVTDCHPNPDRRVLGVGVLVKTDPPDGPLAFFHNTCLVRDNEADASFNHFAGWGDSQRTVLNNIFVAVNTIAAADKPISFLPNVDPSGTSDHAVTDGNCYFRTGQHTSARLLKVRNGASAPGSFQTVAALQVSPYFTRSQSVYTPGFEDSGLEGDPKFRRFGPSQLVPASRDDLRLRANSDAAMAGVELQEPLRSMDTAPHLEHPAMGFLPLGAAPLAVGVDGRRVFPAPSGVAGAPSHGAPPDTLARPD